MIYPYIKVNQKVVDYLGVSNQRYKFADGNYMLWKFDLMSLGGNNDATIRRIGGVGMSSEQVRREQRGDTVTELPVAEDERFRLEGQTLQTEEEVSGESASEEEQASEESSDVAEEGEGDE